MPLTEITNEKGDVVGITDRVPATVYVGCDGHPTSPKYWLEDGNGERVSSVHEEIEDIEKTKAELEARQAELEALSGDQRTKSRTRKGTDGEPPL